MKELMRLVKVKWWNLRRTFLRWLKGERMQISTQDEVLILKFIAKDLLCSMRKEFGHNGVIDLLNEDMNNRPNYLQPIFTIHNLKHKSEIWIKQIIK